MEEETPALAELLGMKMRALQRRAVEMGVGEDALEDAEDKSELIVLIMAHMQSSSGAAPSTMSEGAVEPAQSEQPAPDGPRGGSSPELIRLIYVHIARYLYSSRWDRPSFLSKNPNRRRWLIV